jgi:hypothetical protein
MTMKRFLERLMAMHLPGRFFAAPKTETPITRISVLTSGKVLLDGEETALEAVPRALQRIKARNGVVWYYRESGRGEPPAQAVQVFKLIVENKLPISLSTKADFSDFVDEDGRSQPRK